MGTESYQPHPQVTVYDNIIDSKRQDKLISALMAGEFHLTLNNSHEEINQDFVLCKKISGDDLKHCSEMSLNEATMSQFSFKHIKKELDRLASQADIRIGTVDDLSVHVLTIADTLLSKHDEHAANKCVLIYMANQKWKMPWNGELVLYENTGNSNHSISCVIPYKPGRIVVMEGDINYRVNAPSASAPKYMVMAMLKYWKEGFQPEGSSSNLKDSETRISYTTTNADVMDRVYL